MDIVALLTQLSQTIASLQSQLADVQAVTDAIAKSNYDKGFADGQASVPPASDKIYSQAELDAAVQGVVGPLQAQVTDLQGQVAALQASVAQQVADAVAVLKADLLGKVQALEESLK